MTRSQLPAAAGLLGAAILIVAGVWQWSPRSAWVVAGVLMAGLTVLLLLPVGRGGAR